jgi:hypothetical protein
MLHQSSTVIIGAGSCWLFLLLGWAAVVNNIGGCVYDTVVGQRSCSWLLHGHSVMALMG